MVEGKEVNRDIDKEEVRVLAKKIMDEFISALNKVEEITPEFGVQRDENVREPFENKYSGDEFKSKILKNAPKKDEDFIIAEKKKW